MTNIEHVLSEWHRPVSPLTAFAKSLRMEGEKEGGGDSDPSDPFKGVDLDELPENVRNAITQSQTQLKTQATALTETETKRKAAEDFARKQQSEADKAKTKLRSHNLDSEGAPATTNLSGDKMAEKFEALFLKDGLPAEQAKGYAKLWATGSAAQREEIMQDIGVPLANTINHMQANTALSEVEREFSQAFEIKEVADQVRGNIAELVKQGTPVTKATVQNLLEMSFGAHVIRNPDVAGKMKKSDAVPNLRSSAGGGGYMNSPGDQKQDGKPPTPREPETIKAIEGITGFLNHEIVSAKKGTKK